jgi:putative ABC transport system ATP-binding protein
MAETPLIELDSVSKDYGGTVPTRALSDVTLSIHKGEFVAIVGESGSGKSTLLNILGLLDTPTSGSYVFEGREVSHMSSGTLAYLRGTHVGFIFQAFHLIPSRSVLDNVAMAGMYSGIPRRQRKVRAQEALERLGMREHVNALPRDLSGGEKQRVAIARAICHKPTLILCDEPTGNLDSQRSESIMHIFQELHRDNMTIVMVTHNEHQTRFAERVFRMRDGILNEEEHEKAA